MEPDEEFVLLDVDTVFAEDEDDPSVEVALLGLTVAAVYVAVGVFVFWELVVAWLAPFLLCDVVSVGVAVVAVGVCVVVWLCALFVVEVVVDIPQSSAAAREFSPTANANASSTRSRIFGVAHESLISTDDVHVC